MSFLTWLFGKRSAPAGMLALNLEGDARAIHALAYAGPTNAAGDVEPEGDEWKLCQAVIVLADPVESWDDYGFQDYVYSITPLPEQQVAIYVAFNALKRADRAFLFVLHLEDEQERKWLAFLRDAGTLSIVNGPSGTLNSALLVEINSPIELGRLSSALAK